MGLVERANLIFYTLLVVPVVAKDRARTTPRLHSVNFEDSPFVLAGICSICILWHCYRSLYYKYALFSVTGTVCVSFLFNPPCRCWRRKCFTN